MTGMEDETGEALARRIPYKQRKWPSWLRGMNWARDKSLFELALGRMETTCLQKSRHAPR